MVVATMVAEMVVVLAAVDVIRRVAYSGFYR